MKKFNNAHLGQWADTPYSLIETPKHKLGKTEYTDPYIETASEMCVVHNAILRGLNSIYVQGPYVQSTDFIDFIGYSLCWFSVIHEHHSSEEELFFPEIEENVGEKGLLDDNVEQHRSFQLGLEEFKEYLEGLAGKEQSFDATRLNDIIDTFAPSLYEHLESEIQSLLALAKYGKKLPIAKLWSEEGKRSVTAMTKFSALPFFFLNLDATFEDYLWKDWPAVPGPVKWTFTHSLTMWHKRYWKFASCDQSGIPKPLYAQAPRG